MSEPSVDPSKLRDWLGLTLAIGSVAVAGGRAIWNLGSGYHKRLVAVENAVKELGDSVKRQEIHSKEFSERQETHIKEFSSGAYQVLERLEEMTNGKLDRLDNGQTANLQAMATLSADVRNISERVERVEENCRVRSC